MVIVKKCPNLIHPNKSDSNLASKTAFRYYKKIYNPLLIELVVLLLGKPSYDSQC